MKKEQKKKKTMKIHISISYKDRDDFLQEVSQDFSKVTPDTIAWLEVAYADALEEEAKREDKQYDPDSGDDLKLEGEEAERYRAKHA